MTSRPARPGDAAAPGPAVQSPPDRTRPHRICRPRGSRSQRVQKGLFKLVSSFLQLATSCLDSPSDISASLQEGPNLLLRWPQKGGSFGS
ncbi:uncharacterized protein VSU04_009390 isoform 4-T4 [Chlamydotis macqueenii]